jgi:hypothetical protein
VDRLIGRVGGIGLFVAFPLLVDAVVTDDRQRPSQERKFSQRVRARPKSVSFVFPKAGGTMTTGTGLSSSGREELRRPTISSPREFSKRMTWGFK